MDDIVGMLILWAIGIGGAFIVLSVELIMKGKKSIKNDLASHGN